MSKNRSKMQGQLPLWVSQNFLTGERTLKRVLSRTTLNAEDHVLEIGPGKGHITRLLAAQCRKVTAVELDGALYGALLSTLGSLENLRLHHRDFLQWRLPASGAYKVFANIPFCHTTAILRKLTESENPPEEAWLTMEKGAALRFMGKPRETLRSLTLKPLFDLDIAYHFLREDFHPKPSVDVVLLHLKRKAQPDIPPSRRREYERFLSHAFQGGGAGLRRMFTKRQLTRAFREAGIGAFALGDVLYVQWLCLFRCYCKHVLCGKEI